MTKLLTMSTQKGPTMRRTLYWALIPALLLAFALGLAACGDDDDEGGDGGELTAEDFEPTTAPPDDAKKGGTLTVVAAGDVDYLDPGAAYYQFTYMLNFAISADPGRLAS